MSCVHISSLNLKHITLPCMCYPSVHCGLPASRVRSRAHLLKSEEKKMKQRDVRMSGCFSQCGDIELTRENYSAWCQRASVAAAYMLVSCSLWCGGRVCTHASCTLDWSRADLKGKRAACKNISSSAATREAIPSSVPQHSVSFS